MLIGPALRGACGPVALIFHDILRTAETDPDLVGFAGPVASRYKLTRSEFEAHLDMISAEKRCVGRYDEPRDSVEVLLTFDDGGASALLAAEMLAARGWHGHFFVTTARLGTAGFLDADGVRALAAAGHVIGSHSHTHPSQMRKLDRRALSTEWHTSREILTEILGSAPTLAAIPGGSVSPAVLRAAHEAGYEAVMTSEPRRSARRVGGVEVIDRYTIWASTNPARVRGYLAQRLSVRCWVRVEWALKTILKRASPSLYQRGRKVRARLFTI